MHSVHGSISEGLARATKDWLEDVRGLHGFFDVRAQTNNENTGLTHLYVLLGW